MISPHDYLVDTNILIRYSQERDPAHLRVRYAVDTLRSQGATLYVAQQNLMEFWNTATRPLDRNGYGLNPTEAASELGMLEDRFPVLAEPPEVFAEWKRLVVAYEVRGIQVHDAHLVATMRAHGLTRILTLNVRDFARYAGIAAVHPDAGTA